MCTRPILIKNPNRGIADKGINRLKDCTSAYIPVPCGHCKQCMQRRQLDVIQRASIMAEYYWPFFFTLTYKSDMLPTYSPDGEHVIRYADMRDVTLMFKRLRLKSIFGRSFKYFVVSELGGKRARPHFHGMLFFERLPGETWQDAYFLVEPFKRLLIDSWQRNTGSRRSPHYENLSIPLEYYVRGQRRGTYDFQFALNNSNRSADSVAFYVSKYCLKPSKFERKLQQALKLNYPPEEYVQIWNKVKPRCQWSKDFGLKSSEEVRKRLHGMVVLSEVNGTDFPQFHFFHNTKSAPLSRYYKNADGVFPVKDAMIFFDRHCIAHGTSDGYIETPDRDPIRTDQEDIDLFNMQDFIDAHTNNFDSSENPF